MLWRGEMASSCSMYEDVVWLLISGTDFGFLEIARPLFFEKCYPHPLGNV